jgi:hypothetical protein
MSSAARPGRSGSPDRSPPSVARQPLPIPPALGAVAGGSLVILMTHLAFTPWPDIFRHRIGW